MNLLIDLPAWEKQFNASSISLRTMLSFLRISLTLWTDYKPKSDISCHRRRMADKVPGKAGSRRFRDASCHNLLSKSSIVTKMRMIQSRATTTLTEAISSLQDSRKQRVRHLLWSKPPKSSLLICLRESLVLKRGL